MRRSQSGGSGGNFGGGGPLITGHLKDIDLELDLLKRKRDMMEQQQFVQPLIPERNFNQVPFYALEIEQSSSQRDFSHLYDDRHQQSRDPFTRKRPSAFEWQDDSYPKRFYEQGQHSSNPHGWSPVRNKRPYDSGKQPARSQYQPKFTPHYQQKPTPRYGQSKPSIGQKISKQAQQKNSKFINKVTKPKTSANKLNSPPITECQKLDADTIKTLATLEGQDRESLRLLPNKEPTKQMTGRLELALGSILRDIREKFGEDPRYEVLRIATLQRVVKQTIRERIRKAMLGKVVGSTIEIVKEYRDIYPITTDIQIVNIALKAGGIKPKEKENSEPEIAQEMPQEYFNKTMIQIIGKHLYEMFDKVEEIYNPKTQPAKETCSKEDTTDDNTMEDDKENGDEVANEMDDSTQETNTVVDPVSTEKSQNEDIVDLVETEAEKVDETPTDNKNSEEVPLSDEYKKLLPGILKIHIPSIVKMIHLKRMFKQAVGVYVDEVPKPMYVDYGNTEDSTASTTSEMPKITPKKLILHNNAYTYFVKVMGKPELPKKNIMSAFLDKFNPKSIKKHRTVHNLLFVGLNNKSDVEAIVKEDGTVIGGSTLNIRSCEKNTKPTDTKASNSKENISDDKDTNNSPNKDVKTDAASDGDLLGAELDGQISDLLASIKKEVYVDTSNTNSKNQDKEGTNEGSTGNTDNDTNNLDSKNNKGIKESLEIKEGDTETKQNEKNNEAANKVEVKKEPKAQEVAVAENAQLADTKSNLQENKPAVGEKNSDVTNVKQDAETNVQVNDKKNGDIKKDPMENEPSVEEKKDQIAELKNTGGRATPTRASTRLANTPATPSSIRTRRTSRLINN